MPVLYIADNELFVFVGDFSVTIYRNDLLLVTECSNYQVLKHWHKLYL